MLSKKSVENFRNMRLKDCSYVKNYSNKQLNEEIRKLLIYNKNFEFIVPPFEHQKACFLLGVKEGNMLFELDMGGGKTKVVLDLLRYHKVEKTLVLVPSEANVGEWKQLVEEHSDLLQVSLVGSSKEKWDSYWMEEGDLYVVSYPGLMHMVCDRQESNKKNKKMQMGIDPVKLNGLLEGIGAVVYDEIHYMKNRKTLIFKICDLISSKVERRYGLTGTPVGRDLMDLWSQFYLIDRGKTFGYTITMYRQAFFRTNINRWGAYEYFLKSGMEKAIHIRSRNSSIRYKDEEFSDIPKRVDRRVRLSLPAINRTYYEEAMNGLIKSMKEQKIKVENAYTKLRQISSGFLDLGEKSIIRFEENPKLEFLEEKCLELPEDQKMIIFVWFRPSGDMIEERLKHNKLKYSIVRGGVKDPIEQITKFKNDIGTRFLIANYKTVSHGGNFQIANHVFFYESPESPIVRKQSEKRCHRTGQTRRVYFYDVICSPTEERILEFLREGKNLFDMIIEGKFSVEKLL